MADHWVKVLPDSGASIELDTDPTFSDAVPEAWWSILVYIPSSAQTYLNANSPSPGPVMQADGGGIEIKHITGTTYEWSHSGTSTGAAVIFDAWFQLEWHIVAGSSTTDFWINGTHYSFTGSLVSGANFFNAGAYAFPGTGTPVDADDWIGYDELSSSTTGQISLGSPYYLWSLEDSVDPLTQATIDYPNPPFNAFVLAKLSLETPGGGTALCDTIAGVSPCGSGGDTAESDPSDVVTAADPPSGDPPGSGPGIPGGVAGNDCNIGVVLDGVDVSLYALEGSVTRTLNRPARATVKLPMSLAFGGAGSILKVSFDGTLFFHGMVMDCETDSGEDDGYTVYNASDPMELWQWRVVRDDTCDFSVPTIIQDQIYGPNIMQDALLNTVDCGSGPPTDAEGDIFLTIGGVPDVNGCDLTGAPVDWPMTIAQLASLLVSTGCLDIVVTPTDPGGGIMGTVDFYNGDYGTDLSGSVVLQYGMGNYTIRQVRWNEDMSSLMNKNWYYLGPRVETEADPKGDQHWRANITGTNPEFNPSGSAELVPPGGRSVDGTNTPVGPPWTNNELGEKIYNSRVTYGVRMQVSIYDARGDEATVGKWLYLRTWQSESWARADPRALVHVTPVRGYPIGLFDIGDIITVEAVSTVKGGFSGAQRIYGYTASWTQDGPCEISELQTSSDVGVDTGV